MSKVKELMEKRNDVLLKMTAIIDKAEEEVRAMTETEQQDYEKYKKELEGLNATIAAAEERAKREARNNPKTQEEKTEEEEVRAFEQYCRGETRALKVGTNGEILPRTVAQQIITKATEMCPIMELATVYNVKGELVLPYYDEKSTAIEVAYIDELSDLTEKSGEIKGITLKGWIVGSLVQISRKLINNEDFDIVSHVISEVATKMAEFIEKEALTGNASKIKGILPNATNKVTAADATLTADLIIKTQLKVKTKYQKNAVWIMNTSAFEAARLLKDENGRFLLVPDMVKGEGYMMLGKRVYLSDNMPEFAQNNKVMVYGDLKGYAINMPFGIETQVLSELFAKSYSIGIIAFAEVDGAITHEDAIAVLEMGAGA